MGWFDPSSGGHPPATVEGAPRVPRAAMQFANCLANCLPRPRKGRRYTRASMASALALLIAVAPAVAEAPLKGAGPLMVQVGQAEGLSHIEFRWSGGARMSAKRSGQTLVLSFSRKAAPDISRLQTDPPAFLKGVSMSSAGGGLQITLTLTDDGDARTGVD